MTTRKCYRLSLTLRRTFYSSEAKRGLSSGITLTNVFSNDSKQAFQKKLSTGVGHIRTIKLKEEARDASVLIPLCTINGEPSLLYMVRPMTIPQHRGEVCFPGGKVDEDDHDLVHTALREAHEEIGLNEDKVDIWGKLGPIPSRDGTIKVVPVIGYCGEIDLDTLTLNDHEAASVFTRTIESLCLNVHSTQFRNKLDTNSGYTLPVYSGGQNRIWGLTAIFTHQVLHLLIPDMYKFKLIHKGAFSSPKP